MLPTPPPTERLSTKALTPISGLRALAQIPPPSKRRAPPPPLDLDSKLCGTGHPLDPYHVRGLAPKDQPAQYRVRPPVHRPIPMGINKTKFEREEEYAADPSKLELDPVNACRTCMAKGYRCFVEADPTVRERWRCWMCTHACSVAAGRMHLFGSTRGRKNGRKNDKQTPPRKPYDYDGPRSAQPKSSPFLMTPGISSTSPPMRGLGTGATLASMEMPITTPPSKTGTWATSPIRTPPAPLTGPLSPTDTHRFTLSASLAATDALSSRLERQLTVLVSARAETAQLSAAAHALTFGAPLSPGSELARDFDALGLTPCRRYFFDGPQPTTPSRKRYWQ